MKQSTAMGFLVLWAAGGALGSWSTMTNPFKTVWLSLYSPAEPSSQDGNECSGCAQNRVAAEIERDPILTELRVEYVKQQILKKLRLEKPPEVSLSISTLPKPLINGHVLDLKPGEPLEPQIPAESFYGKTNQIVVFPNEGDDDDDDDDAAVVKYLSSRYVGPARVRGIWDL